MIRLNKNLIVFTSLLIIFGAVLIYGLQKLFPLINHVAYYCQSLITTNMIPIPYYLSIIPLVFLSGVLVISFIKFTILNVKVRLLKYQLNDKVTVEKKVIRLIQKLKLQEKTVTIKSTSSFAFCLGLNNPKIYISTGLIKKLTVKEIEVVLRHEQYHLENHDTVVSTIATFAYSLFPFFPLIGDLIQKYRIEREIAADKFAVQHIGDANPLISTLKKLLAFPMAKNVSLAAIADPDTLEPRIYSLINKTYKKQQFPLKHFFISTFFSLLVLSIVITPVHAKEIHHEAHDLVMLCTSGQCMNSCTNEKNLSKIYSEIPNSSYTPMH